MALPVADGDSCHFQCQVVRGCRLYRVIEVGSAATTTTLIPAGAVLPQRSQASTADECSFASVSRAAKRGGSFVVTIADLPQPSLYVSPTPLHTSCSTILVSNPEGSLIDNYQSG